MNRIRAFLLVEGLSFATAGLIHAGRLVQGYEHPKARIAEAVIATVLLAGLAWTWIRPAWLRPVGIWVQAFALLGTMVGIFTIAVGVGPRTVPDILYHVGIVIVLVGGLRVAASGHRSSQVG